MGALLPKRIGAFLLKFIIRLPNLLKLFRMFFKKTSKQLLNNIDILPCFYLIKKDQTITNTIVQ